jgi:hypothetical protein
MGGPPDLTAGKGRGYADIQQPLDATAPAISRWRKRFAEYRNPQSDD